LFFSLTGLKYGFHPPIHEYHPVIIKHQASHIIDHEKSGSAGCT
jgi:hypothetical protein